MDSESIKSFLDNKNTVGLVGATINKDKWGYKIFKDLKEADFRVYPINPKYERIDGDRCYPTLLSLTKHLKNIPDFVLTITPPKVTESTAEQCKKLGINKIWMQPGSESERSIKFCKENDIMVVYGVCIVVDALKKYKFFY